MSILCGTHQTCADLSPESFGGDDIVANDCEMSKFPARSDFRFPVQMHMNFRMSKDCLPR